MPIWTNPSAAAQKIGVLLFDHFSNHCLANAIEPLRAANMISRKANYSWQFLTLTGAPATSSSGLQVAPHGRLGTEGDGDLLFVLPSYAYLAHATPEVGRGLRAAAGRYKSLAGFDTGSWLLADAGLLDQRRATIHWQELNAFQERFPEVDAVRERYVVDGNRLSSSGGTAAFDLVLSLIGARQGEALALDVAALFMQTDAASGIGQPEKRHSATVTRALAIMQDSLEEPLALPVLARRIGRTQRVVETRFRLELGATPQAVYKRLRLGLARRLASESDLSIAEIAVRTGYTDPSAMTRAFREEYGRTPTDIRLRPASVRE